MNFRALAGTTALTLVLSTVAAFADVTPEEVWENWKAMSAQSGTTVAATSEARDGDTLVITGVTFAAAADQAADAKGMIDEVRLRDLGDGTVEITQSESYTMTVVTPAVDGIEPPVAQEVSIAIKAPGAATIVSGSVEAMNFAFNLPSLEATIADTESATSPFDLTISATNATGAYLVEGTAPMTTKGDLAAESMAIALKGKDSTNASDVNMTAAIGAMAATFDAVILDEAAMADMGAALLAGFAFHSNVTYGATSFTVDVTEATGVTAISGSLDGGSIALGMDKEQLAYQTGSTGLNLSLTSPDIPFPELKISLAESGFGMTMPTTPSDAVRDFSFLVKAVDLQVSDELWAMADPTGQLSHDPATVILDSKGTAKLTGDIFAQGAAESADLPGELLTFDLTQLLAKFAAAELSGTGAFTFDNTDLVTYGGMPAPTGKIDLKLTGGNALMDKAVAMGLMSEEDAAGFRMMLSMFANAGAGEDELTSTLEFKDGGFFANGQRLQ